MPYAPTAMGAYDPALVRRQVMAQILMNQRPANTWADAITNVGNSIAGLISGRLQIADAEVQQAKLAELLMGAPGGVGMNGMQGSPELAGQANVGTPGLLGDVDPRLVEAMLLRGQGDELLQLAAQRAMPQQGEGFTLSPGAVRYDANGNPIAVAPSAEDMPNSVREMQTFGMDPSNPADVERYFALRRQPAATVNVNTGDKPIEGSAAAPLITLPGVIAETPQVEKFLFPGGKFSRQSAAVLNVPYLREVAGAGGIYSSIRSAVQAKLRRESGAAIGEQEVDEQLSVYMPSMLDSDEAARSKFERFKREVLGTLQTSAQGRVEVPASPEVPDLAGDEPGLIEQGLGMAREALGIGGGGVPVVQDQAAYDRLPVGAKYQVGDGVTRTKR